ncbi:pyridoxal-phosphate dependent enzyme [Candidatus Beckwithbacteria bacterium]|nr:pyridoxal-phosphate dependent enzyme [Candidatus Beckwithbacteria bacterium]
MIKFDHFNFNPTPINYYPKISKELGIRLWVKHDDLFEIPGGGNKARMLYYILKTVQDNGYNYIVSIGDIESNHLRSLAIISKQLGLPSLLLIHSSKSKKRDTYLNYKLCCLTGAKTIFINKSEVSIKMDEAIIKLKKQKYNPFYLWGGAYSVEGAYAYYEAVNELKKQIDKKDYPDYIFLASGMGTTQVGIIVGCSQYLPNTKVIGISIARKKEIAIPAIKKLLNQLYLSNEITDKKQRIFFDDSYSIGYKISSSNIIQNIKWAAKTEGLLLDPIYTGKAFTGLRDYVIQGKIKPKSKVIFWHTGGFLNMLSHLNKLI